MDSTLSEDFGRFIVDWNHPSFLVQKDSQTRLLYCAFNSKTKMQNSNYLCKILWNHLCLCTITYWYCIHICFLNYWHIQKIRRNFNVNLVFTLIHINMIDNIMTTRCIIHNKKVNSILVWLTAVAVEQD